MPNPRPLVECVPNFSEGRDAEAIRAIADAIAAVPGVRLLDVDPGRATNRTVMTFVGAPDAVVEGAFQGIRRAAEVIDMRRHEGEHPRMGATDVCPLVPIAGITMAEVVELARALARRVGEELAIPVYLYEAAASMPARRNLAAVRAGEYEGLEAKLDDPDWRPDFGPAALNARAGATAIGARNLLVAYNINLNTTSTRRANAVAFDLRESGRIQTVDGSANGAPVRDAEGRPVRAAGLLPGVKGIGWYIEEYGIAQVSLNLTDLQATPLHTAFDAACAAAEARGMRVTGSELVGLVPLSAMVAAGRHYLQKQARSLGVPERELVRIAARSLGLHDLAPFDPDKRIIEYRLCEPGERPLAALSLTDFAYVAASESPAPGGGSVAAAVGALGAAMGAMVANLSAHKRGWDDRWAHFSAWAERGQQSVDRLLELVDDDTHAFDRVLEAYRLPKATDAERALRDAAVEEATKGAIASPLAVIRAALEALEVAVAMSGEGLPSSISDAGVGALCARTAIRAAALNVRINAPGLADRPFAEQALAEAEAGIAAAEAREAEAMRQVLATIDG